MLISEAAKQVHVETHVLRYWEEELKLPIKRNEMGHRYYTSEDVRQFKEIKLLKEQGLQLKAIRTILQKGSPLQSDKLAEAVAGVVSVTADDTTGEAALSEEKKEGLVLGKKQKYIVSLSGEEKHLSEIENHLPESNRADKAARLQQLLQHMIVDAVKTANEELCTNVKESILKELDYQFRAREEREEEHWKMEEEHYRKVDELLRQHYKPKDKQIKPIKPVRSIKLKRDRKVSKLINP